MCEDRQKTSKRGEEHVEVRPEAGEHAAVAEPQRPRLRLERGTQLAVADHHEPRVRPDAHHARGRVEERAVVLVVRQRRDVADDERAVRDAQRAQRLAAARRRRPVGHALVDDADGGPRDAVLLQTSAMAPLTATTRAAARYFARESAPASGSRRAGWPRGAPAVPAAREQAGRERVRVVQLHHAGRHLAQARARAPGGRGPEVAAERDRAHVEPRPPAPGRRELLRGGRPAPPRVPVRHRPGRQQHLVLPAAPRCRRVDVHHPHPTASCGPARSASRASRRCSTRSWSRW
jgi:hypothetical protein